MNLALPRLGHLVRGLSLGEPSLGRCLACGASVHPEDRNLVFAFEELAFYSKEMKILGVYPAHPFRATFEEAGR